MDKQHYMLWILELSLWVTVPLLLHVVGVSDSGKQKSPPSPGQYGKVRAVSCFVSERCVSQVWIVGPLLGSAGEVGTVRI